MAQTALVSDRLTRLRRNSIESMAWPVAHWSHEREHPCNLRIVAEFGPVRRAESFRHS